MPLTPATFSDFGTAILEKLHGLQRYRVSFEGYSLIALMGLVGFAAWHSGTNLLYLIFAMLISVFLVHGFIVWMMLRKLEISRRLPAHIHALEETPITLVVRNRRRLLSAYGIRLVDHLARGHAIGAAFTLRVLPRDAAHVPYAAGFPHRGMFSLRRIELTTRFPFGLVERGFSTFQPQEIVVYPPLYRVDKLAEALTADFGEYDSQKKGEGTDFYGLREYAQGDPARLIHWRSSARTQKLVVLEHEKDERRRIAISLMNVTPTAEASPANREAFEQAVTMAASLSRFFINAGYDVQLVTASGATDTGSGEGHLYRILRILATVELLPRIRVASPPLTGTSVVSVVFRNAPSMTPRGATADAREWEVVDGSFVRRARE